MRALAFVFVFLAGLGVQADVQQDINSIKKMAGCYQVQFNFAETFTEAQATANRSPVYQAKGLEWVTVDSETPTSVWLQHVLITPSGIQKHWRQEWDYQASTRLQYKGDLTWVTVVDKVNAVAGQWTQRVYQVDDSPRYECSAPWIHWADKSYWECQTWSPLPRREFSQRSDYNVMNRRNRQEIHTWGWMHEEDNDKLLVAGGQSPTKIAREKGENSYLRLPDANCAAAETYWKENKPVWNDIQGMWKHVRGHHPDISLVGKVGGQTLWQALFEIADRYVSAGASYDQKALLKEAHDKIHEFFK